MTVALTHSPADIVRQALVDAEYGVTPTGATSDVWPIYCDSEPNKPDNCITVIDTTPRLQGRLQPTGETVEFPGIQVKIRAISHAVGWTKASAVSAGLDAIQLDTITISTSTYLLYAVNKISSAVLGKEQESNRHVFTINAVISVRQTS